MAWIYYQSSGKLFHNQEFIGQGYSGYPPYVNKADAQHLQDYGPIPLGDYFIRGVSLSKGPNTIILEPNAKNNMFGRHSFRIHGDSSVTPGSASQGCIILRPEIRRAIIASADKNLQVRR